MEAETRYQRKKRERSGKVCHNPLAVKGTQYDRWLVGRVDKGTSGPVTPPVATED